MNFFQKYKKFFSVIGIIVLMYTVFFLHYQYIKSKIFSSDSAATLAWQWELTTSDVYPLTDGHEALLARIAMIEKAEESIDMQYYIWHRDNSGMELFARLYEAANRWVKIRLLLDDMDTVGADDLLATLDLHENIEIRLYNAFLYRTLRFPDFLFDFPRVNQRMHNKSFTIDGKVSVVGGRNIGDEYFAIHEWKANFADLDVIARGKIADDTQKNFELYWNSSASTPISSLVSLKNSVQIPVPTEFSDEDIAKIRSIVRDDISFTQAEMILFSDSPQKKSGETILLSQIFSYLGNPKRNLSIVSPYFIPQKKGIQFFSDLAKNGIDVAILTNAYEATDVSSVHGGYAGVRVPLLQAGVKIFELKKKNSLDEKKKKFGFSESSLHAKTFSFDGEKIFIGSMNFDPRSIIHNTEMGYILHYPDLAKQLESGFANQEMLQVAYQLSLDENKNIQWRDEDSVFSNEPGTTLVDRIFLKIIDILPIKWLL